MRCSRIFWINRERRICRAFLTPLKSRDSLARRDAEAAFDAIFAGSVDDETLGAFLLALHSKGETPEEILGAALSMRRHAVAIESPPGTIDIVGTGGDAHGTLNVSTAVALVVAAAGVPVAKHGNRAASSRSGSSDVLAALGINLNAGPQKAAHCLRDAGCCFLHAPNHHPAMRHVAEVRRRLGVRTVFNLLGPLTNPANVKRHLVGVYDLEWLGPIAEILLMMESETAWVVHGQDGLDEITTTTETDVVELKAGTIRHFSLSPDHVRLPRARLEDLKGGDPAENAVAIRGLLAGERTPYRDIVLFNAAAALIVGGRSSDLPDGLATAADAVDSGAALRVLDRIIAVTS